MRYLNNECEFTGDTRSRSTAELRADLREAQRVIAAGAGQSSVVGVIEGWIGQELRMRTPGLNGQPAL
jgi:hypothetical protein